VNPVFDLEGSVLGMYGRKITPNLREGTPLHLYLPGPHRGVWNELALQVSKEIILCESLIDALTFWCAGFRNVTASYGVGGFTADHKDAFVRHGVQRVWIAYDRDDAGETAALSLAEELMAMGIECFRVLLGRGLGLALFITADLRDVHSDQIGQRLPGKTAGFAKRNQAIVETQFGPSFEV
jgi:hypothetical protein